LVHPDTFKQEAMKRYIFILFFISAPSFLFAQNLKLNMAERYCQMYRYYEASLIYQELFEDGKLNLPQNENALRNGIHASIKSKRYPLAYEFLLTLEKDASFQTKDFEQLFELSLLLNYTDETKRLLTHPIITSLDKSTQRYFNAFKKGALLTELKKDSSNYLIEKMSFNSQKGDFTSCFHPKGIVFTSARENSSQKWSYDQSSFLNLYLYDTIKNEISKLNFLETKKHDGTAFYDSIEGFWYFSRNLSQSNQFNTTGLFIYDPKTKTEKEFAYNDPNYFVAQPFLSSDGKTLWFSSDRPGGYGQADIWYCLKREDGWSEPINAGGKINTLKNEMFPTEFQNVLYFSSNGIPGLGGLDLFASPIKQFKFETPKNMGGNLNSNGDDFCLLLNPNEKTGYFSSNRENFVDCIYKVAMINTKVPFIAKLSTDFPIELDLRKLPVLVKKEGIVIDTLYANHRNEITFSGDKQSSYSFETSHPLIQDFKYTFDTQDKNAQDTTEASFELLSKYILVKTQVLDEKTKQTLPNSLITFLNPETGVKESIKTNKEGMAEIPMLRNQDYDLTVSHQGYFDKHTSLETHKKVESLEQNVALTLIMKGNTFAIENILYDFGKATLREESKLELDKMVDFLNNNPTIKVELSAHTDSRGSDAQNLKLSQARAQSCVDYLISRGISKQRIVAKGYGESKLVNRCKNGITCSEDEHQQNRRTEIKILSLN
jgi:outer membrane protein OmpA-like peptidoglycan-associated protein